MQGVLERQNGIDSWELMMATFYKGDWVEVSNKIKWWKHWRHSNNVIPGNPCEVIEVKDSKAHPGVVFLKVKYRNKEAWALDSYCIKIKKYDAIFDESLKRACDQLQRHEKICKGLRDDILREVFADPREESEKVYEDIYTDEKDDELYSDWEEVTTKECVPLPGGRQTIDTSQFVPTEWMTDEELDEYYGNLVDSDDRD